MINADIMTAIVTPFSEDGSINFDGLEKLTNHLIDTGSRGFVIGGTTGETPTLSHDEKIELYTRFAQIVNGRGTIIAGTGSNNTAETAQLTAEVGHIPGIDYALVVVPYYNKPNQRGMVAHFTAVAEQSPIPLIMYNIPGRTCVTMANETVVELSHNSNIAGVKQCTSLDDLEYLVQNTPDDFNVYTGEDAQALSAKTVGANGVISVAAHIYGREMRRMYDAIESGDVTTAGNLMRFLSPKIQALFMYPSPSCVKAILNVQGFGAGDCRLPILSLNDDEKAILAQRLGVSDLADIPVDGTEMARS
ncbi:4-hydroxy-tetrahydrodipicolinate synthase [Lentilactobacillus parabuchneri]|uniref:4-hydroxy-tetrahydrodipicolinate synthase n=1 Tax=Lentilactobacillus parabuchneri TaxID=152331 RepID=UPI000A10D0F3|nr:4-hydroxy-tetrahydrodipicolinate synthase [Lentilactobacillus parabuchneri]ORN33318.1 4-hydroxy-tetrahydrodipicolinate synthase [Lentilactobacillus parabuchneri]ORN33657.1 4-hydroxy-tetrahydrodipicolinate synthase [Lentilactobacillus parabuchneri]ORN37137.1 4-hydroxy-tetrahydrodipicolinate synthase [Lentilactobacillus parabuchneri]